MVKKCGIKKTLLLCLAMFIAGYLVAVCTVNPENLTDNSEGIDYDRKLDGITYQIKDMVKEYGSKAYIEICEFIKSIHKDDDEQTSEQE